MRKIVSVISTLVLAVLSLAVWPQPVGAQTSSVCVGEDWAVLGDRADWAAVELVGWAAGTRCLLDSGDRKAATLPQPAVDAYDGQQIIVVGGTKAVPELKVYVLGTGACLRLAGADRLETMRAVVQFADDGGTGTLEACGVSPEADDPPQGEDRSGTPVHDRDAEMRLRLHAVAEWFADRGASAEIDYSVEAGRCGFFSFATACVKQSDPIVIVYNWGDDADDISQATLAHEYAHVWQFHHQPNLVDSDPLWVVEGFADLFGHWYGGEQGAECPLGDVRFNDLSSVEDRHTDNLHYTLGECAVRYLDETRGRRAILDYFRSQGDWDERFYTSFGVSPQGFYDEWANHRYQLLLVELAQTAQALIGANSPGTAPDCDGVCVHDHYYSADGRYYFVELRGVPASDRYCEVHLGLEGRRTGDWSREAHWDGHDGRFVIDVRIDHDFDGFEWECS